MNTQTAVHVSSTDKNRVLRFLASIPDGAGDVEPPEWPSVQPAAGAARDAEVSRRGLRPAAAAAAAGERDAEAEQADAAQAQGAVVPGGLSDREASALQAQRKANAAFRELRTFNKGDVLVLMGPQGHLEIAQAKSNTNLDTQDAFEVSLHQPNNTSALHPRAFHSSTPHGKPTAHHNGRSSQKKGLLLDQQAAVFCISGTTPADCRGKSGHERNVHRLRQWPQRQEVAGALPEFNDRFLGG